MRAEVVLDARATPEHVIGVLLDITDRKHGEEERERLIRDLAEREEELRAALDAASMATFDFDHEGAQMKPSSRLNHLFGYPPDHVLTLADIRARYHPDFTDSLRDILKGVHDPAVGRFDMELHLLMPDGKPRWLRGIGEYIRSDQGRVVRSRGVISDVTSTRQLEASNKLLLHDLDHRMKNVLATVQAIAHQTFLSSGTAEEAEARLSGRLAALAAAHDMLVQANWQSTPMSTVVNAALAPHRPDDDRIRVAGAEVGLNASQAQSLALAIHELATNAAKYGALSAPGGTVDVTWQVEPSSSGGIFRLSWREAGGPAVAAPTRRGFGSQMVERLLAQEFGGTVRIDYDQQGLVCELTAPYSRLNAGPGVWAA